MHKEEFYEIIYAGLRKFEKDLKDDYTEDYKDFPFRDKIIFSKKLRRLTTSERELFKAGFVSGWQKHKEVVK